MADVEAAGPLAAGSGAEVVGVVLPDPRALGGGVARLCGLFREVVDDKRSLAVGPTCLLSAGLSASRRGEAKAHS